MRRRVKSTLHPPSPLHLSYCLSYLVFVLCNSVFSWLFELAAVSLAAFENIISKFVIPCYHRLSASRRLNPDITFSPPSSTTSVLLLCSDQTYLYRVPWKQHLYVKKKKATINLNLPAEAATDNAPSALVQIHRVYYISLKEIHLLPREIIMFGCKSSPEKLSILITDANQTFPIHLSQ